VRKIFSPLPSSGRTSTWARCGSRPCLRRLPGLPAITSSTRPLFCSCIFFFDQCEIEAAKPKVDLAVTNRLYHYREAANPKNRDQHQLALTTSSTISSTSRRPTNLRKELDWGCFHTLAM